MLSSGKSSNNIVSLLFFVALIGLWNYMKRIRRNPHSHALSKLFLAYYLLGGGEEDCEVELPLKCVDL